MEHEIESRLNSNYTKCENAEVKQMKDLQRLKKRNDLINTDIFMIK